MGDEGPSGVSIALCTRAVLIRTELAAASARLGPERAEYGSEMAETAMKWLRNGWNFIFHQPRMLGNGLDHGVVMEGVGWPNVVVSGRVPGQAPRARGGGKPCVNKVHKLLNCELIKNSNLYEYRAAPAITHTGAYQTLARKGGLIS